MRAAAMLTFALLSTSLRQMHTANNCKTAFSLHVVESASDDSSQNCSFLPILTASCALNSGRRRKLSLGSVSVHAGLLNTDKNGRLNRTWLFNGSPNTEYLDLGRFLNVRLPGGSFCVRQMFRILTYIIRACDETLRCMVRVAQRPPVFVQGTQKIKNGTFLRKLTAACTTIGRRWNVYIGCGSTCASFLNMSRI